MPWKQWLPIDGEFVVQKCASCGQERRRLVRAKASWDGDDTDRNLCIREDDPRKQWTLRGG